MSATPTRPIVQARLKRLHIDPLLDEEPQVVFRVICGREHPCPHQLGFVLEEPDGTWKLDNDHGYYGFPDTGYRIWKPGQRPVKSRRPGPGLKGWLTDRSGNKWRAGYAVGEEPELPAEIICHCGTLNLVAVPETATSGQDS